MAGRDYENEDGNERMKAIRAFNGIYRSLQKKRALRLHTYTDIKSALIEVREYGNNGEVKTICRVKAENETDCHRIAAQQLKWELEKAT